MYMIMIAMCCFYVYSPNIKYVCIYYERMVQLRSKVTRACLLHCNCVTCYSMGQPTLAFLRQSAHKFVLGNGSLTTQLPVHGRWHHAQVGPALYQCQAKDALHPCSEGSCVVLQVVHKMCESGTQDPGPCHVCIDYLVAELHSMYVCLTHKKHSNIVYLHIYICIHT